MWRPKISRARGRARDSPEFAERGDPPGPRLINNQQVQPLNTSKSAVLKNTCPHYVRALLDLCPLERRRLHELNQQFRPVQSSADMASRNKFELLEGREPFLSDCRANFKIRSCTQNGGVPPFV